jgi:hypothetical protein
MDEEDCGLTAAAGEWSCAGMKLAWQDGALHPIFGWSLSGSRDPLARPKRALRGWAILVL